MKEHSVSQKIGVVAGVFVSFSALVWLLVYSAWYKPPLFLPRVGFVSAVFCALGCLILCWAAFFAYVVRKCDWTPRACALSGLLFVIPGLLLFIFDTRYWSFLPLLMGSSPLTIGTCRKFAFPELTPEQAAAPPPPIRLITK